MLIELLEKQLALHKSLLQLAHMKTEAIQKNEISQLNQIVRDEQKHVSAVMLLEKRRTSASAQTVSELLPYLPEDEQEQAGKLRGQLLNVITQLKEVNDLNAQLLDQSLQLVHLQLDLLAPPDAGTYAADGESGSGHAGGPVFDSKA